MPAYLDTIKTSNRRRHIGTISKGSQSSHVTVHTNMSTDHPNIYLCRFLIHYKLTTLANWCQLVWININSYSIEHVTIFNTTQTAYGQSWTCVPHNKLNQGSNLLKLPETQNYTIKIFDFPPIIIQTPVFCSIFSFFCCILSIEQISVPKTVIKLTKNENLTKNMSKFVSQKPNGLTIYRRKDARSTIT